MKLTTIFAAAALSIGSSAVSFAENITVGDLQISNPVLRATVPGAKVAGGYMHIENNGKTADRLVAGSAGFSGEVQIHEMKIIDDVMKMRQLKQGLEIPAGESVHLKPGGYHVMFIKLGEQLKEKEMRKVKLVFEKAGDVEVEFAVKSIAATMKHGKMDHSKMDHKKMKKSD